MKVHILIAGIVLWSQPAFSQLQEIRVLQRSLPLVKDSIEKNDVLIRLAQLMGDRQPDSSYYYLRIAKAMAERMNYAKGMAMVYKTYGSVLGGNNNYLAATYLNNAIEKFQAIGDKEGESMALMNMANLMYLDEDSVNADAYLKKSYQMTLSLAKDSVRSIIMNNLNLHSPNILDPQVDAFYKEGSAIAKKYRDGRMMLYYKFFEGLLSWEKGSRYKSLQILKSSLQTADSIGNVALKLSVYFQLGSKWQSIDTGMSRLYYQQGLEEATTYHFSAYKLLFAQSLYDHFKKANKDNEALLYATMMLDARQKHQEELRKYGFTVVNYVEKDKDLETTRKKQETSVLLLIVFIVLSITAVALLFFVFRSSRISKRFAVMQKTLAEKTRVQNKELEDWNKFHDTLLSVLAHDLRQPFSSIIMTSQLLEFADEAVSKEELKSIMLDLNDTAFKSIDLLDGLLYWVKSKKENFTYITEEILLRDNIAQANGLFSYNQQNKQISFLNEVPGNLTVRAHEQMLLFINRNLISNATKYSPKGGTIRVFSEIKDNEIIVSFVDQGSGMTPEQVEKLFSIDETNKQKTAKVSGAGIALNICYDMIQQMNGRMWVETSPGQGSKFCYALTTMAK
ncbi:MAG: HAMP domain-containing sensor histidine kinase [Bacteroidota bacterium]